MVPCSTCDNFMLISNVDGENEIKKGFLKEKAEGEGGILESLEFKFQLLPYLRDPAYKWETRGTWVA